MTNPNSYDYSTGEKNREKRKTTWSIGNIILVIFAAPWILLFIYMCCCGIYVALWNSYNTKQVDSAEELAVYYCSVELKIKKPIVKKTDNGQEGGLEGFLDSFFKRDRYYVTNVYLDGDGHTIEIRVGQYFPNGDPGNWPLVDIPYEQTAQDVDMVKIDGKQLDVAEKWKHVNP